MMIERTKVAIKTSGGDETYISGGRGLIDDTLGNAQLALTRVPFAANTPGCAL